MNASERCHRCAMECSLEVAHMYLSSTVKSDPFSSSLVIARRTGTRTHYVRSSMSKKTLMCNE